MDVSTILPMKPVLVEHVSDNVSVLQQTDVEKQKTVLTARAISDLFKCAPIKKENPSDEGFFDPVDDKVNLDFITEACSRSLLGDQYKNGPKIKINSIPDGGSQWAIDNQPDNTHVLPGMLYVFSILDDGQMTWANYDGATSIFDTQERRVDDRGASKFVRQVFVPNGFNEYLKFDGTKGLDAKMRTRYNFGVPWTRMATASFKPTMDTEIVPGKAYYKKDENGEFVHIVLQPGTNPKASTDPIVFEFDKYTWENWYMMSRFHNGAEYFPSVIIPNAIDKIENPLVDTTYHIYNKVNEFVLPNPNLDGYKVGQKLQIEVHPPIDKSVESWVKIIHTDTDAHGGALSGEDSQALIVTPRVRRNTKDVYGDVREDVLVTSVALFEIVEIREGEKTLRTWELDAGVEESDFTAGLAEMLGEHTDQCTGDLVQYQRDSVKDLKKLTLTFPITQSGYVVGRFMKTDVSRTLADATWKAVVQVVNLESSAAFIAVPSIEETPDPDQTYFVQEAKADGNLVFKVAENWGHPTHFIDGVKYFTVDTTHASSRENVIQVIKGTSTQEFLLLEDLQWDEMRRFTTFAHRNSLLVIEIQSSNPISTFQDKVFPEVLFYPDPHNSYIQKAAINPSAYTFKQLEKLFLNGDVIDDITLAVSMHVLEGMMNAPASSRALIDAYTYLANKLQMRGRLLGNRQITEASSDDMDQMVHPGFYFVEPELPLVGGNSFPTDMPEEGCNIVVIGNDKAPSGTIHEEDGGITPATRVMQIAFIMNKSEIDPVTGGVITDPMRVETRVGIQQEDKTWVWYPWRDWLDWNDVRNKPLYYRSRWELFADPDDFINHIDSDNVVIRHNYDTGSCEVTHQITEEEIVALMQASEDPEYDPIVKFKMPQLLVGLSGLGPTKWEGAKEPGENMRYVVDVQLPAAVPTQLYDEMKDPRRKIRFLFYGRPGNADWDQVIFRLHYPSSFEGRDEYMYERNWGGEAESALDLTFEQADLPNGDRAWCPVVIG